MKFSLGFLLIATIPFWNLVGAQQSTNNNENTDTDRIVNLSCKPDSASYRFNGTGKRCTRLAKMSNKQNRKDFCNRKDPNQNNKRVKLFCPITCGKCIPQRENKIVGGAESMPGEFPYFTLLSQGCGASLISDRIVLTAAHCGPAQYNLNNKITVGAWKRSNLNNSPAQNAEKIKVTKVSEHPDYNDDTVNNDYALLLLKTPYVIDSAIYLRLNNDAALPSAKMKLDVLGMGTTKEDGNVAEMLRDVQVPAMTNKECKKKISGGITNKMLCAGYEEGMKDSCQGDSGGPLVQIDGNKHTQVGIVSWGFGCAQANSPGVYSRVSAATNWMKKVICDEWKIEANASPQFGDGQFLCDGGNPGPAPQPQSQPTPTPPAPQVKPTSPPQPTSDCSFGESDIELFFKFDDFSSDISWKVSYYDDQDNPFKRKNLYRFGLKKKREKITVCNNNCYAVTVEDFYGDGLCCDFGKGRYDIRVQGKRVYRRKKFGERVIEKVCLDKNGKFLEANAVPIVSPTKAPTRKPTRRPTRKPTRRPTPKPTEPPTPTPTLDTTEDPTYFSTTDYPTFSDATDFPSFFDLFDGFF